MLEKLIEEYLNQFPEAESPFNYFADFGEDTLIKILQERDGRELEYLEPILGNSGGGQLGYKVE